MTLLGLVESFIFFIPEPVAPVGSHLPDQLPMDRKKIIQQVLTWDPQKADKDLQFPTVHLLHAISLHAHEQYTREHLHLLPELVHHVKSIITQHPSRKKEKFSCLTSSLTRMTTSVWSEEIGHENPAHGFFYRGWGSLMVQNLVGSAMGVCNALPQCY